MDTYEITLTRKHWQDATGIAFSSDDNGKPPVVTVQADSVSIGGDRWVKFYELNSQQDGHHQTSKLVYSVIDEYVSSVRNLGVIQPKSQPPLNADALEPERLDFKHELPIGTVLRLTFPTEQQQINCVTDMVLIHRSDGWMSSVDGYCLLWKKENTGPPLDVYSMLLTAAKVEVAEFRTVL